MYILGISCFYHDSAACLVKDGEIIAAAQEERFTRKKHDHNFPENAVNFCLAQSGISANELEHIVFYDKPLLKFERILLTHLTYAPFGFRSFLKAMPLWLKQKLWMPEIIREKLEFKGKILFLEHHQSHAASAFFPSPFQRAAVLTMDGVGEWATASCGKGSDNNIHILKELNFPHSPGLLYSAFTYYTGFKVNSGEYKLMGLAPYGEPKYTELILNNLIDLKADGSFRLNMEYFDYCAGLAMTNKKFDRLFNGPPRKPESKIEKRHMDIARSIQAVCEEIMLRMARHSHSLTREKNLCLAGGVALNCVGNGRILREGPFEKIWIQPAAGDAGAAMGAALFAWHQILKNRRESDGVNDHQQASLLGPEFSDGEIMAFLQKQNIPFKHIEKEKIAETAAELLSQEKVLGWFQGKMEFGPRALGARSILGDPRPQDMQSRMNLKIKFRESFRPFAPSVPEQKAREYFEIGTESPYMLLTFPVKEEKAKEIPAVTHVDRSARVQTVNKESSPLFWCLLEAFHQKTGCPVLINTSFNVRGEPIVCTPQDAYRCFQRTNMDCLMLGSFLLEKKGDRA